MSNIIDKKIIKEILSIFIPSIIAYFSGTFAYILDGIYIGNRFGKEGLATASLVNPFILLINVFFWSLVVGGNTYLAHAYARNDKEETNKRYSIIVKYGSMLVICAMLIIVIIYKPLLMTLNFDEELINFSMIYFFPMLIAFVLNYFCTLNSYKMRVQGDTRLLLIHGVLPIIINGTLNYIFLFILNLNICFVAVATIISYGLTLIVDYFYLPRAGNIINYKNVKFDKHLFSRIFYNGFSDALFDLAKAIVTLYSNIIMLIVIGTIGLSILGVLEYVFIILLMPVFAIGDSINPLVAKAYGKKDFTLAYKYRTNAIFIISVFSIILFTIINLLSGKIIGLYGIDDISSIQYMQRTIFLYTTPILLVGYNQVSTAFLTAMDKPTESLVIGVFKNIILILIFLTILSILFGAFGLYIAYFVSEFTALFIVYYIVKKTRKDYGI